MASASIRELTDELPYSMRDNVEGYVDAVDYSLPDIAREAGVKLTPALREQFLLIVAIRRIWGAVNGQFWIMDNCANIADERGLAGFRAGRETYSKGSEAYQDLRVVRERFDKFLSDNNLRSIVATTSLSDALVALARPS